MVRYGRLRYEIDIPEDVEVKLDDTRVTVKGKKGEVSKEFDHTNIRIQREGDQLILTVLFPRRKEKALIGTVQAHINNMILGVQYGYKYYLKIVFSHFPIRVKYDNSTSQVVVENLYGGRKSLYAKVYDGVNVKVDGDDVILTGCDKESVGQSAANIQELTRQRGKRRKSPKTFMDGLYIFQKEFEDQPPEELEATV